MAVQSSLNSHQSNRPGDNMDFRRHINCGGALFFDHKEDRKTFFKCRKCKTLVNIAICPSYNQYVLSGRIKVSPEEYDRIKDGVRTK